jgi:hypothetical protein
VTWTWKPAASKLPPTVKDVFGDSDRCWGKRRKEAKAPDTGTAFYGRGAPHAGPPNLTAPALWPEDTQSPSASPVPP